MRGFQSGAHFLHQGESLVRGKAAGLHRLAKVHAVDEFHDEVMEGTSRAEIEDGDDVGMIEASENPGFAVEAFFEGRIIVVDVENFERNESVELGL